MKQLHWLLYLAKEFSDIRVAWDWIKYKAVINFLMRAVSTS